MAAPWYPKQFSCEKHFRVICILIYNTSSGLFNGCTSEPKSCIKHFLYTTKNYKGGCIVPNIVLSYTMTDLNLNTSGKRLGNCSTVVSPTDSVSNATCEEHHACRTSDHHELMKQLRDAEEENYKYVPT